MKKLLIGYAMALVAASVLTLKTEMESLHQIFGVNFIYDSSLVLDVPYKGKPMEQIAGPSVRGDKATLEECLKTLFAGTGIDYEIMKKYVVLTRAGAKKKPKEYTIFIEERLYFLWFGKLLHLEVTLGQHRLLAHTFVYGA